MKWFFGLIIATSIFMSIQTLRADDEETQSFAKLICHGDRSEEKSDLFQSFFLDVNTLEEIQSKYPERFQHVQNLCHKKRSQLNGFELSESLWSVESVAAIGRAPRIWNAPCTENTQCESGSCNLRLNKCNPDFEVPFNVAN